MQRSLSILIAVFIAGLLLICTPAWAGDVAVAAETYYSIHVASFKQLKNANAFVNSLQEQGKVVFWKGVQVRNKGYFFVYGSVGA